MTQRLRHAFRTWVRDDPDRRWLNTRPERVMLWAFRWGSPSHWGDVPTFRQAWTGTWW